MKKIGMVLNPYGEKRAAGLGRSIFNIAKHIIESDTSIHYTIFIKGNDSEDPRFATNNYKVVRLPNRLLWLDRGINQYRRDIELFIFFTPSMPIFIHLNKSLVLVHDMGPWFLSSKTYKEYLKRMIIRRVQSISFRRAKTIIAVSEFTKGEILSFFPLYKDKIKIIYNGFDQIKNENVCAQKPVALKQNRFFLFIGVLKSRKNPLRVIKAFEQFKKQTNSDVKLVFAGTYSKNGEVNQVRLKSKYKEDILMLGYVTDQERVYLYQHALALIFPSLYEGFGLPVLEAMGAGLPVLTSNIGAVKEVAGEAAVFVDPMDEQSIASGMLYIASKYFPRDDYIQKGYDQSKKFSWENTGNLYVDMIKKTIYENT